MLAVVFSMLISCTKDDQATPAPVITDFSPTAGEPGTVVVIHGKNFSDEINRISVAIGGVKAEIMNASSTQLTVEVPSGANTGKIALIVDNVTVYSDGEFTILESIHPVITSFAPATGRAGDIVVISGSNFSTVASENEIAVGGTPAEVMGASSTEITIKIPEGAVTGLISLKIGDVSTTSVEHFVILPPPVIDSFSPAAGLTGSSVSLYGYRFSTKVGGNVVKVNNVEAEITEATTSKITFKVPAGASTGKINLIVDGISLSTTTDFVVIFRPVINSIEPAQGSPGITVTIEGEHFDSFYGITSVLFANNILATVISGSDTKLIVSVPSGATTGKVTVVANLLARISTIDFEIVPPVISGFHPVQASSGESITIEGENFSTIGATDNHVKIGGVSATVTSFTRNQLVITVPTGVSSGKISVEVAGNIGTSNTELTILE